MEANESFSSFNYNILWKTLISECNIPSKTESKGGVGEKSEKKN
jgi:hypothetical protein